MVATEGQPLRDGGLASSSNGCLASVKCHGSLTLYTAGHGLAAVQAVIELPPPRAPSPCPLRTVGGAQGRASTRSALQ